MLQWLCCFCQDHLSPPFYCGQLLGRAACLGIKPYVLQNQRGRGGSVFYAHLQQHVFPHCASLFASRNSYSEVVYIITWVKKMSAILGSPVRTLQVEHLGAD